MSYMGISALFQMYYILTYMSLNSHNFILQLHKFWGKRRSMPCWGISTIFQRYFILICMPPNSHINFICTNPKINTINVILGHFSNILNELCINLYLSTRLINHFTDLLGQFGNISNAHYNNFYASQLVR